MRNRPILHCAVLIAVLAAAYGNSLGGSFHYDDFHSIVENPHIRTLDNAWEFFFDPNLFSGDPDKSMYRPALLLTYAANFWWGEYNVTGYHIVNLLIHVACALLIRAISVSVGASPIVSLASALVFGLHPLATEPVNYISSRSELMAAFGFMAAFWSYLRWRDSRSRTDDIPPLGWYVASLVVFTIGLLSKSVTVSLPLILLLYERTRNRDVPWRSLAVYHVGYWVLICCYLMAMSNMLGQALGDPVRSLDAQLWTQAKAAPFYGLLATMPVNLNVEHQFFESASMLEAVVAASLLLLVSVVVVGWRLLPQSGLLWAGWIVLSLAPTVLVPLNVLVNEHRLYLAMAGACLLAATACRRLPRAMATRWVLGLVLLCFGILSSIRNAVWDNELDLWKDAAERAPEMPRVHVHLGNALRETDLSGASKSYRKALRIDRHHRAARTNLGNLYIEAATIAQDSSIAIRYYESAAAEYEKVLREDPEYAEALNNLGSAYMLLGRTDESMRVLRRSVEAHPNFADAFFNIGQLYVRLAYPRGAAEAFERSLELKRHPETYSELAKIYAIQDRLDEAASAYREAVRFDPENVEYLNNLGEVLGVWGQRAASGGDFAIAHSLRLEAQASFSRVDLLSPGYGRSKEWLSQLQELLR